MYNHPRDSRGETARPVTVIGQGGPEPLLDTFLVGCHGRYFRKVFNRYGLSTEVALKRAAGIGIWIWMNRGQEHNRVSAVLITELIDQNNSTS